MEDAQHYVYHHVMSSSIPSKSSESTSDVISMSLDVCGVGKLARVVVDVVVMVKVCVCDDDVRIWFALVGVVVVVQ